MNVVHGNYIGIVVNSNPDPEGRGRVQVFVPHLSTTLYEGWNKENKDITITQGSLAGIDVNVLQRLQQILPWAESAFPLLGTGGTTYADPSTGTTRPSLPSSAPEVGDQTKGKSADNPQAPKIIDKNATNTTDINSSIKGADQLTDNEILYAMRIAATETGAGVLGSDYAYKQATDYQLALKNSGKNARNPDGSVNINGLDFGYTQANLNDIKVSKLQNLNNGSYKDQIISTALQIRNLSEHSDKSVLANIQAGNFDAADNIIGGHNSPSIGTKYFGLADQPAVAKQLESKIKNSYNGNVKEALNDINNTLKPTSTSQQLASSAGTTSGVASSYPNKILDPTRKLPPRDMRTPNGISSVPLAGTLVWCFFQGGDPQRPVYFAGVSEPFAQARTASIPTDTTPLGRNGGNVQARSMPSTDSNGNLIKDSYGNIVYNTQTTTIIPPKASC